MAQAIPELPALGDMGAVEDFQRTEPLAGEIFGTWLPVSWPSTTGTEAAFEIVFQDIPLRAISTAASAGHVRPRRVTLEFGPTNDRPAAEGRASEFIAHVFSLMERPSEWRAWD